MLELAPDRASGAYPYLVTPDCVASAREILGAEPQLAVLLDVVPETDPGRAREIVRGGSLQFLATLPATPPTSAAWASSTTTSRACRTGSSTP
jgi:hypothetical protein